MKPVTVCLSNFSPVLMPSQNFKNPLGLLGRMLLSGDRVAYSTLLHESMRRSAPPLDWLLRRRERKLLADAPPTAQPLVLVVGAPRSGTTLAYQVLSRFLDVSYFTNLSSFFPKSPLAATRMLRRMQRDKKADFKSYYGQTARLGGPHDGFFIWNRWLGEDRYVPADSLTDDQAADMRNFFNAWTATFDKPFLNKNNRNTSCIDLLADALPAARFVIVRRDPLYAAQSLIHARERVQGDKRVGWGLEAKPESAGDDDLAYVDDVCRQLQTIESRLAEQSATIAQDRIVEIAYEELCANPHGTVHEIADRMGLALHENRMDRELSPFEISAKLTVSPAELERLRAHFLGTEAVV